VTCSIACVHRFAGPPKLKFRLHISDVVLRIQKIVHTFAGAPKLKFGLHISDVVLPIQNGLDVRRSQH
jgi:hypothetical protein